VGAPLAHRLCPLCSGVLSGNDGLGRAHSGASCSNSNCVFSLAKARSTHPERLPRVRSEGRPVNGEYEAKKARFLPSRFHRIARTPHEHRRFVRRSLLKPCASRKEKASHCNGNCAARNANFANRFAGEICGKIKIAGAADLNALPKVQAPA